MTAVSAVIFLATAKYNLATVYIIGRVEAGEYPLAIAYSSVLIVFMLAVLLLVQKVVGEARLGRARAGATCTGNEDTDMAKARGRRRLRARDQALRRA